ncbi:MAG: hypothetical protein DCC75_12445 [Proteobacteria bacterium]|nr:MAG: hypothetical protein DCC75_12445 [Pseudomonadota bacterium]
MTSPLNQSIQDFGRAIFAEIGQEQPSAFNKKYWIGKIMEWSITQPEFKTNMFRLVDVLPALRSSAAIAGHVREYLAGCAGNIHGLLGWGLSAPPNSITGKLTSHFVKRSVIQMANFFIAGRDAREALPTLKRLRRSRLAFTVDLLGEFSTSEREANLYVARYLDALDVLSRGLHETKEGATLMHGHPGEVSAVCVSIKLTALYSQCSPLNYDGTVQALSEKLALIARKAKQLNASIYVDAEDTANNQMIYASFKKVFSSDEFRTFPFPGIVVQAYCKDSPEILDDLIEFTKTRGAPISVRLVKGAYWDQETILAAQNNWPSPLFSDKESSDANFEALSRTLIDNHEFVLPAFGSHNVRSLAHACCYAEHKKIDRSRFELQMLYGMAEPIARAFAKHGNLVRLYVPLGDMIVGMGYLVRRLLENTSNESFLRSSFCNQAEISQLLEEPVLSE